MSKLDEAGLPKPPEGMHWYLNEDLNGNIRLALMARYEEDDVRLTTSGYKVVKSIWIVDAGENTPQIITAGVLVNRAHEILRWWDTMEGNKTWLGVTGRDVSA